MKFITVGPTFPFRGGISHYATLLSQAIRRKHDCMLVSFKRQYPANIFPAKGDKDEISNIKIVDPAAVRIIDSINPFSWLRAFKQIKEYGPDGAILHWWSSYWFLMTACLCLYLRVRLKKARIVVICHNLGDHERNRLAEGLTRAILHLADAIIVHTTEAKRELEEGGCSVPVFFSPHPEYSIFNRGTVTQAQAREKLGISFEKVILFFGFIRPYKGLDVLIDAFELISRQAGDPVRLLIAGEIWDRKYWKRILSRMPESVRSRIILTGRYIPNEEVEIYFMAADLVVLPYRKSHGSGVMKIASAFNKPVLTTIQAAESEKKSSPVMSVPPDDANALARAIFDFFEHEPTSCPEITASSIQAQPSDNSWETIACLCEELVGCDD